MGRFGGLGKAGIALVAVFVGVLVGYYLSPRERRPPAVSAMVLYERYCASCHGDGGRGDGPVAIALRPRPRDLTRLKLSMGTSYSLDYLARVIDGRETVRAHGTSSMPVWGEVFSESLKERSRARELTLSYVRNLAVYLDSMQVTPR